MTRDTTKDTAHVWFDLERGYVFRDTEEAPEGPWVSPVAPRTMAVSEDMDPIQTAIGWLKFAVKNHGVISPHDFEHLVKTVIPEAEKQYNDLIEFSVKVEEENKTDSGDLCKIVLAR